VSKTKNSNYQKRGHEVQGYTLHLPREQVNQDEDPVGGRGQRSGNEIFDEPLIMEKGGKGV
jgi:hypothetical protein